MSTMYPNKNSNKIRSTITDKQDIRNSNNSNNKNNSNNNNQDHHNKCSIDQLFQQHGKLLKVGDEYRIKLYKGPSTYSSHDPVDAKAPVSHFPLIAKFPIASVVIPQFTKHPWNASRLYEQDIPKPVDDSDDDAEKNNNEQQVKKRWRYTKQDNGPAPRQWILQEQVDFLETMVSRREQVKNKKKSNDASSDDNNMTSKMISSRYEGVPEHTTSHYALVRIDPNHNNNNKNVNKKKSSSSSKVMIQLLPPMATIAFQQPSARRTLSLSQAEQIIQDQRAGVRSSWMMDRTDHNKQQQQSSEGGVGSSSKKPTFGGGRPFLMPQKSTKDRLLKKLKAKDNDDDIDEADDIMGDVAFRSRKGAGASAARRELFTSLGDGITISDDGVLGGTNDAAYGGRQRFGRLQTENNPEANAAATSSSNPDGDGGGMENDGGTMGNADFANSTERGADGAAMSDDFYMRDVGAEYEELDFDAAEQFDDDDVDLGEGEVLLDGYNNNNDDDDNNNDNDDSDTDNDDDNDDSIGGAEGLASVAGFKALLAKARGEVVTINNGTPDGNNNNINDDGKNHNDDVNNGSALDQNQQLVLLQQQQKTKRRRYDDNEKDTEDTDHFAKIVAAAELANEKAKKKQRIAAEESSHHHNKNPITNTESTNHGTALPVAASASNPMTNPHRPNPMIPPSSLATDTGIQLDENGLRIITLSAVQKEIWLNHGNITMKRLMKIFEVTKKTSKVRQDQFKDIVKELCTITKDPIKGMMLILKQHYSNMG